MVKNVCTSLLALSLVLPQVLIAQQATTRLVGANTPAGTPAASPPQRPGESQPQSVRPQSRARRSSYQREVRPHRHSRISKGEVAFMAGIAGTSMAVGAIAGGGTGLAIGAIVGGWGAYVGHRMWNWVK